MGGKVKKTEKERVTEAPRTFHRDREQPGMERPFISHLFLPLMFLTGEGG